MDLSIIVPVHGSAKMLPRLMERLTLALAATQLTYEVIFVEDGSKDHSWEVLQQLQARDPERVHAIQLMRNYGQHNAIMCGFRHARGRIFVTMDDDLQHPPEEIVKLLHHLETQQLDLVYGAYRRKQHAGWRSVGSCLVTALFRFIFKTSVCITSFRALRRELAQSILSYDLNFTFIDGLLGWNTQRVGQVEVEHHERLQGSSGYSLRKLIMLALNLFTNFSLFPLQLASICGFTASVLGFVLATYCLVQYLLLNYIMPGYTSTMIVILCLGGLHLLGLGIIGEYLGRMHLNMNRKPQYVIRQLGGITARRSVRTVAEPFQFSPVTESRSVCS